MERKKRSEKKGSLKRDEKGNPTPVELLREVVSLRENNLKKVRDTKIDPQNSDVPNPVVSSV